MLEKLKEKEIGRRLSVWIALAPPDWVWDIMGEWIDYLTTTLNAFLPITTMCIPRSRAMKPALPAYS